MHFDEILRASRASAGFKQDVERYLVLEDAPRIAVTRMVPRVKVVRLLAQLLAVEPGLEIERVRVDGRSGCADFSGTVTVTTPTDECAFDFVWDCRWRAEQEGWVDGFGFPDQIRAAHEFGWRCFAVWEERAGCRA